MNYSSNASSAVTRPAAETGPLGRSSAWAWLATVVVACALTAASEELGADEVELRDGRRFSNVKTRVRGGRIYVTQSNGRTRSFPARAVKGIVPKAVNWRPRPKPRPKPKPPAKVEPKVEPKVTPEVQPPASKIEPKTEPPKQEPPAGRERRISGLISFGEGAAPIWSGMYRRGNYRWGIALSALELYALARLLPWMPPAEGLASDLTPALVAASFAIPPPGPPPPPGAPRPFNARLFQDNFVLVSSLGLVVHPRHGGSMARADYHPTRALHLGFLAAALLFDALASAFLPAQPGESADAASTSTAIDWVLLPTTGRGSRGLRAGIQLRF